MTYPHPDIESLMAGIMANPDSSTHKMAMADRLAELGEDETAYAFAWAAAWKKHPNGPLSELGYYWSYKSWGLNVLSDIRYTLPDQIYEAALQNAQDPFELFKELGKGLASLLKMCGLPPENPSHIPERSEPT